MSCTRAPRAREESPSQVRTSVTWMVPDEQTGQESVSDASGQEIDRCQISNLLVCLCNDQAVNREETWFEGLVCNPLLSSIGVLLKFVVTIWL